MNGYLSVFVKTFKISTFLLSRAIFVLTIFGIFLTAFFYFANWGNQTKTPTTPRVSSLDRTRTEVYAVINNPNYNKTPEGKLGIMALRGTLCSLVGEGCTDNPKDGDTNKTSIFTSVANLITVPYSGPPSSGYYVAQQTLQNIGIIPKAYAAQGIGFTMIEGYQSVWKVMRDLSFLLIVVITLIIGFLIMFRTKLGGKAAVTVGEVLPKIATTLIFISLSFAIAGFMIDLMYISITFIISLLAQVNIGQLTPDNAQKLQNIFLNSDMRDIWPLDNDGKDWGWGGNLITTGHTIVNLLPGIIVVPLKTVISGFLTWRLASAVVKPVGDVISSGDNIELLAATFGGSLGRIPNVFTPVIIAIVFALLFGFLPGILIALAIFSSLFFLMFRIFFQLLTAYIKIVILIMFAPIMIMFDLIPGRNAFTGWLKALVGELIYFPLVVLFVLVGHIITSAADTGEFIGSIATPSHHLQLPFLHGLKGSDLATMTGVGIVLMIPDLVKMIKEGLGLKGMPVNAGLGLFFGGVSTAMGGAMGISGQLKTLGLESWRDKMVRPIAEPLKNFGGYLLKGQGKKADTSTQLRRESV